MRVFILTAALAACAFSAWAQEQAGQEPDERVQYTLILPEEKAPELVKSEETNPFESSANPDVDGDRDTEENKVRDILLRLPITGGAIGERGMRIMLGGMRLEAGGAVPPVVPDQQAQLKVKAITANTIELVWVEKKPGLIPKALVIPIDAAPKVKYQLPAYEGGGGMGSVRRDDVSAFARPAPPVPPVSPSQAPAEPPLPGESKQTVLRAQPASDIDLLAALSSPPPPPLLPPPAPAQTARPPAPEPAVAAAPTPAVAAVIPKAEPVPEFNLIAELSAAPLVSQSGEAWKPAMKKAAAPAPSSEVQVAQAAPEVAAAQPPPEVRVAQAAPEVAAAVKVVPEVKAPEADTPKAGKQETSPSGSAPTASVWRMLFGNHAPADK